MKALQNRPTFFCNLVIGLLCAVFLSSCGFWSSGEDYDLPPAKGQSVFDTAKTQLGAKYCAGGASPKQGFDCSGLVYWSYRQHGLKVPRTSSDQAKSGRNISPEQIQPGDILVFKIANSPRGLHTALSAGGDVFIHSPGKGRTVRLDYLNLPHWKKNLITIRRIEQ